MARIQPTFKSATGFRVSLATGILLGANIESFPITPQIDHEQLPSPRLNQIGPVLIIDTPVIPENGNYRLLSINSNDTRKSFAITSKAKKNDIIVVTFNVEADYEIFPNSQIQPNTPNFSENSERNALVLMNNLLQKICSTSKSLVTIPTSINGTVLETSTVMACGIGLLKTSQDVDYNPLNEIPSGWSYTVVQNPQSF